VESDPQVRADDLAASLAAKRQRRPAWRDAVAFVHEPMPEREWLITDLVERQGRLLLVGPEGKGKSMIALTLAVQAAAGLTVLDAFEVDLPRRTIYMDLEMPERSTRRRLKPLTISARLEPGALELFHRLEGINLRDKDERASIQENLHRIGPDLLVIDSLHKVVQGDLNDDTHIAPVLGWIDAQMETFDCAVVMVHHLRKRAHGEAKRGKDASDIFGSSRLLRWPELTLSIDDAGQKLRVFKDRENTMGDIVAFSIEWGGVWPLRLADPEFRKDGSPRSREAGAHPRAAGLFDEGISG
jgi:hypothetical protein